MLTSNEYNKAKLLHQLSCMLWFIDKHAIEDAKAANDQKLLEVLEKIKWDINKHLDVIKNSLC